MLVLKRILLSISLLACLSPSKTLAGVKSFNFHFEISSVSEPRPDDCKMGIFGDFKKVVKSALRPEIIGGEIDFYCVPKRHIFEFSDPDILLFIPVVVSGDVREVEITVRLPSLIEQYDLKPSYCTTDPGSCDPGKTRNKINRYPDVNIIDLVFLDEAFSSRDEVQDQLKTSLSVPLVRVLQHNLKVKGFDSGSVDGAWGPRTDNALMDALSSYKHPADPYADPKDSDLMIRYEHLLEFLFPNLFVFKSSYIDQERAPSVPKGISEPAPDMQLSGEIDKPVNPNVVNDTTKNQDSVAVQVETAVDNVSQDTSQTDSQVETHETQTETNDANAPDVTVALEQMITALSADNEKLVERYENAMMRAASLEKRLMDITDKSVIDLWKRSNLKDPTIVGLDPANDIVELAILSTKFHERLCSINPNISLKESFNNSLLDKNCFQIEVEKNEERLGKSRSYDPVKGILKIFVNAKQNEFISAVKTTNIEQFDEEDLRYCYPGIRFVDKNQKLISIPFEKNVIALYDDLPDDGKTVLSYYEPLEPKELLWEDVFVELVDLAPDNSTSKTCSVIPHKPFPIILKDEAPKDNSPVAVMDLDGSLTLQNLPIAKSSPPTLHIFLDPLVGPTAESDLYGFNGAINDPEEQEIQETYFKGYLLGISEFLNANGKIQNLSVFETQVRNGVRNTEDLTNISRGTEKSFGDVFKDEFVASYIASFVAGQAGEYDTKTEKISKIYQENSNSYIISFGSSGSSADIVCGVELKRPGMVPRGIIFDILPDEIISELIEKDQLRTVEKKFAFSCKANPRVVIFRLNQLKDYTNVQEIVAIKLKEMGI